MVKNNVYNSLEEVNFKKAILKHDIKIQEKILGKDFDGYKKDLNSFGRFFRFFGKIGNIGNAFGQSKNNAPTKGIYTYFPYFTLGYQILSKLIGRHKKKNE